MRYSYRKCSTVCIVSLNLPIIFEDLYTWISAAPGQCPASDLPPPDLQDPVDMQTPFWPLLIEHPVAVVAARAIPRTEEIVTQIIAKCILPQVSSLFEDLV